MKSNLSIAVVGGGAAGMLAAITAAKCGAKVTMIEHTDRLGKKILATGNGKCNFTNLNMGADYYYTDGPREVIEQVFAQCNEKDILRFFEEMGIMAREKNGYVYPYSEQAAAVCDVLRFQIESLPIRVRLGENIKQVDYNGKFIVKTDKETLHVDRIILACGSKASPKTGSDGSGYDLAKLFGHSIVPVVPALVQLYGDHKMFKEVAGVRFQAKVTLFIDGEETVSDRGEVQLTDYGISGIPVFQISRMAAKALYYKKDVQAVVNFMPDLTTDKLFQVFMHRAVTHGNYTLEQFLIGIFPKKLGNALLKAYGFSLHTKAAACKASEWKAFAQFVQQVTFPITATKGFEQCQVCAGGVPLTEVHPQNLESKFQKGVYFAGELLDVDGICGGYNLQWAWSTGMVAAMHAVKDNPLDTLL